MKLKMIVVVSLSALLMACAPNTQPQSAPTAASTPSNVLINTVTATPAAPTTAPPTAPTLAPTTAPTRAATASSSQAVSAQCSNTFYPVSATAKWQYRSTTAGIEPTTYTQSDTNFTANGFTEHREFPNLKTDNGWTCGSDGSLMSNQFGNLSTNSAQFQLQTTKNTGVTILAARDWKVGATWNNGYEVKGTMQMGANNVNAQGSIDATYKITAQESVTVPAGTFNAFKVESNAALKLSVNASGVTIPVDIALTTNSWFAQNVGMVKSQSSMQGFESALELLSFTP